MQTAAAIFDDIPEKERNCVHYSTMMKGYAKIDGGGNLEQCDRLYTAMTAQGVTPNIVVMNTLVTVACGNLNLPKAEKYFSSMRGHGHYLYFNICENQSSKLLKI